MNLLRKAKRSEAEIREIICSFCSQHVVIDVDPDLLLDASELRTRYGFSYWDSVVVAAALSAGATVLVSEDMHDGLVVLERLRIVNPFRLLSTN